MKRYRVLSIDFDYFINANIEQRNELFTNGSDEMPKELLNQLWNESYTKHPEIKNIGVINQYHSVYKFLMNGDYKLNKNVFTAESHKDIVPYIKGLDLDTVLEITNIDFHHDYYHYFSREHDWNCGNWLRKIYEEDRFTVNTDIIWVKRSDSDIRLLGGTFPHTIKQYLPPILRKKYDLIFICLSPEWTPPHLNKYYDDLVRVVDR